MSLTPGMVDRIVIRSFIDEERGQIAAERRRIGRTMAGHRRTMFRDGASAPEIAGAAQRLFAVGRVSRAMRHVQQAKIDLLDRLEQRLEEA